MNISELRQMQNLPLGVKILKSKQRIIEWYEKYNGEVYISFSGGKDSTVLLNLVRSIYPDLEGVYIDTGLEYPEIRNFVKTFDNIIWVKPKMRFDEVIKKYGFPIISKEQAQFIRQYKRAKSEKTKYTRLYGNKYGRGKISKKWQYLLNENILISDECCDKIKKEPIKTFEKNNKLVPYIGNLAEESNKRTQDYLRFGCNAFDCKRPISRPLGFWTEQDILKYLFINNIKIAECYGDIVFLKEYIYKTTKLERTGCMFCGFGCHLDKTPNRFQRMKTTHYKQWDYCINKLGMKEALDIIKVDYE